MLCFNWYSVFSGEVSVSYAVSLKYSPSPSQLSWHPTKEAHLAFGTDDGKVGIYDVFSNK